MTKSEGIATFAMAGLLIAALSWALMIGLEKELDRQDDIRAYNCAHYGTHINKMAGSDVCPPTPQG